MTEPASPSPKKRRRPRIHQVHSKAKAAPVRSEINITPLVDVVLVLLIIFMVVTPMLHRGVAIELPETANHERKQDTGEQLIVGVRADGVYIETERLQGEQLAARLRQELKSTSRPVHVRADRSLRYGDVRKVLDEIHAVGAISVSLATDERKAP